MSRHLFSLLVLFGLASAGRAETLTISVPGYSAEVGVHPARGEPRKLVVISLHGKEKGRDNRAGLAFADRLAQAGFTTYTPQMPWHGYSAPVPVAFEFLDALVARVAPPGVAVVVAGHSQGAPYALFYVTAHKAPRQVAGVVVLAPGHLVHRSRRLQDATAADVSLARSLVAQGKGDEPRPFADLNDGGGVGAKSVTTTANTYLSYFDPETSPNFLQRITQVPVPLLWIDGEQDELAKRMNYAGIYNTVREHPRNRYLTVGGGHVEMWSAAAGPVAAWLDQFDSPRRPGSD